MISWLLGLFKPKTIKRPLSDIEIDYLAYPYTTTDQGVELFRKGYKAAMKEMSK